MGSISPASLCGNRWWFGRSNGQHIATITFNHDGSIDGIHNDNESRWNLVDNALLFIASDGRISTRFDHFDMGRGRLELSGPFLFALDGPHHVLRQLSKRLKEDDTREKIQEICHLDNYRLDIILSNRILSTFLEMNIYFGRFDRRIPENSTVIMPRYAAIEPYSCFAEGNTLCAMGAFSYSESPLPTDLSVGRYCSIALGLDIFRSRHPIEWATTSSITYDIDSHGYRSFQTAHQNFNDGVFEPTYSPMGWLPAPVIEHDVWIGQHVQLARGIRIGTGAVIGAGAVVTKDVAPYAIVGGVPAKTIRFRFPDNVIDQLLRSTWWRYDPSILKAADYRDINRFLDDINLIDNKTPYSPPFIYADDILHHVMNSA